MKIRLTLTNELLGTKAANANVFADYIASKAPDGDKEKEELETAEHQEEAGSSVFHRQNGQIGIWDYQIKGFFKDAAGMINRADSDLRNKLEKLTAYKTKIDGLLFVFPRFIQITMAGPLGNCERPIGVDTPKGRRVALCRSESVPEGSTLEFEVKCLSKDLLPYVEMWLGYGAIRGIGQWRNSGKGTFTWKELS